MPSKLTQDLRKITKGLSEDKARKLGVAVSSLLSKRLIERYKKTTNKYLVPENTPRWATKFRFSRKKYGIEDHAIEEKYFRLTKKGKMALRSRKDVEPDEEEPKSEKNQDDEDENSD